MSSVNFERYIKNLDRNVLVRDIGKVTDVRGQLIEGYLPGAQLGSICKINDTKDSSILCEVIGFRDRKILMIPLTDIKRVGFGSRIELVRKTATIKLGDYLLGRILDGMASPMDAKPIEGPLREDSIYKSSCSPLSRKPIGQPLDLGIKSINSFSTVGKGQRVGIMAGSGVGKSVLMGMMARSTTSDINVIALIGERGREVRDFIEEVLGEEGLKKSVVVAVTSDQSPLLRMRGAFVAITIAEYFSQKGQDVLLMMDSLTRFAMAQREIGLNLGERVTSKGYPPSVFSLLPKLVERAGQFEQGGSITGLYTVLVEGDDMDDPIADSVRSIMDGHIVLDRNLAEMGHFPAVDIMQSTSRVMPQVSSEEHRKWARRAKALWALYKKNEDLIHIGAYQKGQNEELDKAIHIHPSLKKFLMQDLKEKWTFEQSINELKSHLLKHEEI